MGQCTSRKAAGAFAASAAATHNKTSMHQHKQLQSPDYDDNKDTTTKKSGTYTKGVATSFGFRRRPVTAPSIADNATAAKRLAKQEFIDRNGNNGDTTSLTNNAVPPGRTTPRLTPPRKEANATRVSRFGFRKPNVNRLNKVADINNDEIDSFSYGTQGANNRISYKSALQSRTRIATGNLDANDNKTKNNTYAQSESQVSRYTLQSSQLPKPQLPVRVIESKSAKQLANNNRKAFRAMQPTEDCSSKEGSMTEDSGVGSHSSAGICETDTLQCVELLDNSPTSALNRKNFPQKVRHYEMVVSGKNFDLRDLDDTLETSVPLPQLPSVFQNSYNNGYVRERRLEYEKHIEKCRRKISITSSEGFSDLEDQSYVQRSAHNINNQPPKCFLKPKSRLSEESSIPSSDEHEWGYAGEAMADEFSYSFSSSDESKDKESLICNKFVLKPASLALQNLMNNSIAASLPKREVKNVLLTIEDPKFAAVAVAASTTGTLLEDETSPVDSLICSYSETDDIKHKFLNNDLKKDSASSSNSKDVNEKLTLSPSSPGTPTNASNSLSLSDGKDYFDDEIADQPALVFDDTITVTTEVVSVTQQNSENTPTLIDNTPKLKRKQLNAFEYSPLLMRKRTLLNSRTASMDTLSPCESITSDDLMLDYDQSQGSGVDDSMDRTHRRSSEYHSLDETLVKVEDAKLSEQLHEWAMTVAPNFNKNVPKGHTSRILRSRASTPSSIPDSPHSLENRVNSRTHSVSRSPMRPPRPGLSSPAGYDSDDSIKIDRSSHGAMVQDIVQMKTMLIKLKRVLNESETLNPFDNQSTLKNGLFNGLSSDFTSSENVDDGGNARLELADLRRQVLFLQGQLDDREQIVHDLQQRMNKLVIDNEQAKSAPASTVSSEVATANAATQTDRVRPISAGPSLLQVSPTDGTVGSLVSVSERRSRPPRTIEASYQSYSNSTQKSVPKLWRKPGEPPSPQLYVSNMSTSSIPRRANSRTRAPSTPS